jgi:hypothetical protein
MPIVIEAIRRASDEIGVEPPLLIQLAPDLETMMMSATREFAIRL